MCLLVCMLIDVAVDCVLFSWFVFVGLFALMCVLCSCVALFAVCRVRVFVRVRLLVAVHMCW